MNLTFGQPLFALILASLAAGGLTYWLYRKTIPELSTGKRLFLGGLRFATLFIILFLLTEPLVRHFTSLTSEPVIAVLIDESQSLTLIESEVDADSVARNPVLSELLEDLSTSLSGQNVRLFGFGRSARPLDSIDSVRTTGSRTDISAALDQVQQALVNEPLGAVLLLSDGRHNGGRNPEHVAESYPVPILTITVGDTTVHRDIRIQQLLVNEISYAGHEVPIRVRIRNEGFEPSPITVSIRQGNLELDRIRLLLPPSGSEAVTELSFVPEDTGLFQYFAEISRLEGEITHRNNTERFSLQVLERKKRLLLVAGAPSPDVSAIIRHLREDEDTELVTRIQQRSATYFEGAFPSDSLEDFDLIVLIGYPSITTNSVDVETIVLAAENGLPVLFLNDRSADLRSVQRSLSGILPARPVVIRPGFLDGTFVPTERALQHAIFDVTDRRNLQGWRQLPPLSLSESRWELAPGAVILADTEIRGISLDDPIMVVSRAGNRRSASLLASGFWRWRNVPEDLDRAAARWDELFSNLVQWLVTEEDDRLVRVAPAAQEIEEGESVVFSGQVYDENLRPVSDASLTLDVRSPSGEILPFLMQALGNGRYSIDLGVLPGGLYTYEASATRDGGIIGTDRGNFSIGTLSIEFRNPHSDARLMQQLAVRSGGTVISSDRMAEIPEILSALPSFVPSTATVEQQLRLWQLYPFLIALVVLMSVEWFFRKRFGLV